MPSPSRRALLGALATLPLAGCQVIDGSGPETTSPTSDDPRTSPTSDDPRTSPTPDDPTTEPPTTTPAPAEPATRQPGEAYEAGDRTVTISDLAVRHGIVRFGTVHADPFWSAGAQFLLATVTVEGEADPADLDVTTTADTLDGPPDRHLVYAPGTPDTEQRLGFAVPTEPAPGQATVVWHGPREVRWQVPDAVVADLGRSPEFSLQGFEVPDPGPEAEHVQATIEVANAGERDGRFLAELGHAALSDQPAVEVPVPSGENVSATRSVTLLAGADELSVVLRWEGGEVRRDVARA